MRKVSQRPLATTLILEATFTVWQTHPSRHLSAILSFKRIAARVPALRAQVLHADAPLWRAVFDRACTNLHLTRLRDCAPTPDQRAAAKKALNDLLPPVYIAPTAAAHHGDGTPASPAVSEGGIRTSADSQLGLTGGRTGLLRRTATSPFPRRGLLRHVPLPKVTSVMAVSHCSPVLTATLTITAIHLYLKVASALSSPLGMSDDPRVANAFSFLPTSERVSYGRHGSLQTCKRFRYVSQCASVKCWQGNLVEDEA